MKKYNNMIKVLISLIFLLNIYGFTWNVGIPPGNNGEIPYNNNGQWSTTSPLSTDGTDVTITGDITGGNVTRGADPGHTHSSSINSWSVVDTDTAAETGNGYFIDASSNNVELTLPSSPSLGDTVAFVDAYNQADTNVITIARGDSSKIEGSTEDLIIDVNGSGFQLVYANSTRGWEIVTEISAGSAIAASQVYIGTWNADTNYPRLENGTGTAGWYYRVTTAGITDFGAGNITFAIGDDVIYNGTIWEKIPGAGYTLQTMSSTVLGGAKLGDSLIINSDVLNIKDDAVTYVKMQNVVNDERILGRVSGADGVVEELTKAQVLTMLNVEDGADVTDTASVTAAGALMDSDVSVFGKTLIDDTDAATARATLELGLNSIISWSVVDSVTVNATTGNGYFIDASSNPVTLILPSGPVIGNTIAVVDAYNQSDTNVITIARGDSSKIEGSTEDLIIDVNGSGFQLVYANVTRGWEIVTEIGVDNYLDTVDNTYIPYVNSGQLTNSPLTTNGTDVTVANDLFVADFGRINALGVGTSITDPGNNNLSVAGTGTFGGDITGPNVTSGANPGHTHTGTSISTLDGGDITSGTISDARLPATITSNITGNAGTATLLETSRSIYGNNFNGSTALDQIITSIYGGTGNGFTKFTGPLTTEKTFTLPNSSATLLYAGGDLGTPSSGDLSSSSITFPTFNQNTTGTAATVTSAAQPNIVTAKNLSWTGMKIGTDGQIPTFDSDGNPAFVLTGTDGQVLTSNGVGEPPTFQAATGGTGGTDLTTLSAETDDIVGSEDYIVYLDDGTPKKKLFNEISIISSWSVVDTDTAAETGNGYFIDASSNPVTLILPSTPSLGDTVAFVDAYNQADGTYAITIDPNSKRIEGSTEDLIIDVNGSGFQLVYANVTRGWEIVTEIGVDNYLDTVDNTYIPYVNGGQLTNSPLTTNGTNVTVANDLFVADFGRINALGVGTSITDPGNNNLSVAGTGTFGGTITAPTFSGTLNGNITGNAETVTNGVYTSRTITPTSPLTGGGNLSANRTISIPAATASVDGYMTSTYAARNINIGNGTVNQYLQSNGDGTYTWSSPEGNGDVNGPSSTTDSRFVAFDGTTGKLIKDSGKSSLDFAPALGSDDNYVTDAEKTVIGNTSGINTGDNTVATSGDSATAFFTSGTIEDARLPATITSNITGTASNGIYLLQRSSNISTYTIPTTFILLIIEATSNIDVTEGGTASGEIGFILSGGTTFSMEDGDTLTCIYNGSKWLETSRSFKIKKEDGEND